MPRYRGWHVAIRNTMAAQDKLIFFDASLKIATKTGKVAEWLAFALEEAAYTGKVDLVGKLLALGASPVTVCANGQCVLNVAVAAGHHYVVHVLLNYHAPIDEPGGSGYNPLQMAAMTDQPLMVAALIKRGASINFRSVVPGSNTALELAAQKEFVDVMETLIRKKADVNAANSDGVTALHQAAMGNHAIAIGVLVKAGAGTNFKDANGSTPLHIASRQSSGECVKALCVSRTDTNMLDRSGATPLQLATGVEAIEAVGELLEAGVDLEHRHPDVGCSALDLAVGTGCAEIVAMILNSGANAAAVDPTGDTALHHVNEDDEGAVVDMLVTKGADVNAPNNMERTPLHSACWLQATGVVRALVGHRAAISALDNEGERPLHLAARRSTNNSALPIVSFLLERGADEAAVCSAGQTAAQVVGNHLWQVVDADVAPGNELVQALLTTTPAERAWRRRGFIVMCRHRFNKPQQPNIPGGDEACGGACSEPPIKRAKLAAAAAGGDAAGTIGDQGTARRGAAESASVVNDVLDNVKRFLGTEMEGVFRHVMGCL